MKLSTYVLTVASFLLITGSALCMKPKQKDERMTLETTDAEKEKAEKFIEDHRKNKTFKNKIAYYGDDAKSFFYALKKDGSIEGGFEGKILFGAMHIKQLIVGEKYRETHKVKGLGAYVMKKALEYGKKKKLRHAFLETFSFQASGFYKKLGFEEEFIRKGFSGKKGAIAFHYLVNKGCKFMYDLSEKMKQIEEKKFSIVDVADADEQKELDKYMKEEFGKHSNSPKIAQGHPIKDKLIFAFGITLENENKEVIGAAKGKIFYGGLKLEELIVNADDAKEQEALQKALLDKVITFAQNQAVGLIFFDTFNKDAKEFYEKHGFEVSHTRDGYAKGKKHYYLTKYF
ncbi:GNAT family N-acetyltransferase [Candidatus Dependentiae bacterium]